MSAMNTSSSVGRRTAMSSITTPASSSLRTASAITPGRLRMAARTVWSSSAGGSSDISGKHRDRALGMLGLLEVDLQPLAADAVLELVGRALGDHVSVVDHHDPVGQPVGLVEVLRRQQHGRAGRHARLDRLPQTEPADRVEAGRRLVEEQHRRAEDKRGREVEPAAHAARVRLHRPPGGLGEVEALEQLVGPLARLRHAACGRAGRPSRGSRSRSGSRRRPRTGRRGRSSRAAQPRRARCRGRRPAPSRASGFSSVARILTAVVLPAPFGPSSPSTLPVRAEKSTPHSARTEPYDFSRPSTTIASVMRSRLVGAPAALIRPCDRLSRNRRAAAES